MKRFLVIIYLFFSCVLAFAPNAFGQTQTFPLSAIRNVGQEEVNPADGFRYVFKRLGEKLKLVVLSTSPADKAAFYRELLGRRLSELKFVIEKPDMANFEKATLRYSATAGMLTEYVINKGLSEERDKTVKLLSSHFPVVQKLSEVYDTTTAEWRFVKQDADYLQLYLEQLRD